MTEIARIRELISEGKSDADIAAQLWVEARDVDNLGWDHPGSTFRSLATTLHRAVMEDRVVGAGEVLALLGLFRLFWEEVSACGDVPKVERATCERLAAVVPAPTVSAAFVQLHADMVQLAVAKEGLSAEQQRSRAFVERRYLRQVGRHPVICCARAGSAVADATDVLFQALGAQAHYRQLFLPEVLQPCVPLLLVHRPTWSELLAGQAAVPLA
jgi:hypothetical protein